MKKFLTYFFVTLGVIFFTLLCGLAYVWFADPFELRPLISVLRTNNSAPTSVVENPEESTHQFLSPTQEAALKSVGINPSSLPNTITPLMEDCFIAILGESRVMEIKSGDTPTATEFFTTRSCY